MKITSIEKIRRGKCRIWLNDEPAFALTEKEVQELALFEGGELSDEQLEVITGTVLAKKACSRAVDILSARDRTCAQMISQLTKEEFPREAVEAAMRYLSEHHYVDDLRYACTFIALRRDRENRRRLTQQLIQRGVSPEVIEQAFDEEEEPDETALIMQLLRKKHYDPDADEEGRQKMIRFLAGKGFSYSQIKKALTSFS